MSFFEKNAEFVGFSGQANVLEWASGQDFCPFTLYEKSLPEENPAAVHRILIDGKCITH